MKELINHYRKGFAVTDGELRKLLNHFFQLTTLLANHELYRLAEIDANNEFARLKDTYKARKGKDWRPNLR